jgi:hypothetical protein
MENFLQNLRHDRIARCMRLETLRDTEGVCAPYVLSQKLSMNEQNSVDNAKFDSIRAIKAVEAVWRKREWLTIYIMNKEFNTTGRYKEHPEFPVKKQRMSANNDWKTLQIKS